MKKTQYYVVFSYGTTHLLNLILCVTFGGKLNIAHVGVRHLEHQRYTCAKKRIINLDMNHYDFHKKQQKIN